MVDQHPNAPKQWDNKETRLQKVFRCEIAKLLLHFAVFTRNSIRFTVKIAAQIKKNLLLSKQWFLSLNYDCSERQFEMVYNTIFVKSMCTVRDVPRYPLAVFEVSEVSVINLKGFVPWSLNVACLLPTASNCFWVIKNNLSLGDQKRATLTAAFHCFSFSYQLHLTYIREQAVAFRKKIMANSGRLRKLDKFLHNYY